MDEQVTFEVHAVLPPRRARLARLGLLVPVVAFAAVAWAGLNGPRSDPTTVLRAEPTGVALPSLRLTTPHVAEVPYPAEAIGLRVRRLGDLQVERLDFDAVVAIAGWYVPTSISECPPLAAIYRDGALPYVRGDADKLAFCVRSGMLYPSRPTLPDGVPTGVALTVVPGVIMPLDLETVGAEATQVVVLVELGKSNDLCRIGVECSRKLLVDHLAWTPGA